MYEIERIKKKYRIDASRRIWHRKKGKCFILGLREAEYKSPTPQTLSGNLQTPLLSLAPLRLSPHPFLLIPLLLSHLPFFTSPHPLRPPSSRCTAGLLSLEELKVALIWSLRVPPDCSRGSECVIAVHSWHRVEKCSLLRERKVMPALTCLRSRLCQHSGDVTLAIMASGHLGHRAEFPFMCCIRLRIYDAS